MSDLAVSLATRVRFAELVAAGDWQAAAAILAKVPTEFPHVERVFLADVRGVLMADVPPLPGVRGRSFAERDWYRGVSRDWRTTISPVYRRAAQPQRNVIAVATPVLGSPAGRPVGILVLQLSLEAFFDWTRELDLSRGLALSVTDAKGQAAFASGVSTQGPIVELAARSALRAIREGRAGTELAPDPRGEARLYAFVPAKHAWGVVIEQPAAAAFATRDTQLGLVWIAYALASLFVLTALGLGLRVARERLADLRQARRAIARHGERLRILGEIDKAIVAQQPPEAIAGAVIAPLRELLGVPRAIVNKFDFEAGEVEWIAAAGRRRMHVGPGVRYPMALMGEPEELRRGVPQRVNVHALPYGAHREALLASNVHTYMVVPMIAGGELIGAVSFGGEEDRFPAEQINIAQEVATQLAIAIAQARLHERVQRHAQELEQRVAQRTAALEAVNKELEAFTYSVSHDLRSPLRAIDGYARMLEEDYGGVLDAEGARLLGVVRASSRQMGQLIDDLLDFSRLGRQTLVKRPVDMTALVREVLGAAAQGAPAQVDLAPLPGAYADPALLRQVWMNLVGNALKYSAKRPAPRIEIGAREEAEGNVYWVRDNGVGFDMRYAGKLFGVFQRLHGADEFPGTGVGLAIVQRVVARHGGRAWAESRVGEGACFYFSLPRHADG